MSDVVPKVVDWDHLRVAPWEKLPGETDRAFAYFAIFRDTPPISRTIAGLARDLGKGREAIDEVSRKWHWRHRVGLYDEYMDAVARQEQMDTIKEMNSRHARTAMVILQRVGQRLVGDEAAGINALDVNKLEASDLARLTEVATKVERLSRGAESDRVGIHKTEQVEVKIAFDTEPDYPSLEPDQQHHDAVEGSGFVEITQGDDGEG